MSMNGAGLDWCIDRDIETAGELAAGGKMIRMRMSVDQIADAQPVMPGERR